MKRMTKIEIGKRELAARKKLKTVKGGAIATVLREIAACELDMWLLSNQSIPNPESIPHVFRNREMTMPATSEFMYYLWQVLRYDKEILRYIHSRSQLYVDYGGCTKLTFNKWVEKLQRDLCDLWRNKYGKK